MWAWVEEEDGLGPLGFITKSERWKMTLGND